MMTITPTVKQLLIVTVLFYIGSQFTPGAYEFLSLHFFENNQFRSWQFFTHIFIHAAFPNIFHLLFNMIALWSFGNTLESFWGGKKFLFFYISCGLGAALLHTAINYYHFHDGIQTLVINGFNESDILATLSEGKINTKWEEFFNPADYSNFMLSYYGTVFGTSGVTYGLMVAFAFMMPNAELFLIFLPIPIKAKYFVPLLLTIDLILGLKGESVFGAGSTVIAHLGGALSGFLMMWFWKKNQFDKNRWN